MRFCEVWFVGMICIVSNWNVSVLHELTFDDTYKFNTGGLFATCSMVVVIDFVGLILFDFLLAMLKTM